MSFAALIWTEDTDGSDLTIALREYPQGYVAAYAMPGCIEDAQETIAGGLRLSEKRARAYGCGWPPSLRYRSWAF